MRLQLKRKFPRGKIDAGETPEEFIRREILEGMGIRIRSGVALPSSLFQYPALADTFTPLFSTSNPSETLEVVRIEHVPSTNYRRTNSSHLTGPVNLSVITTCWAEGEPIVR